MLILVSRGEVKYMSGKHASEVGGFFSRYMRTYVRCTDSVGVWSHVCITMLEIWTGWMSWIRMSNENKVCARTNDMNVVDDKRGKPHQQQVSVCSKVMFSCASIGHKHLHKYMPINACFHAGQKRRNQCKTTTIKNSSVCVCVWPSKWTLVALSCDGYFLSQVILYSHVTFALGEIATIE